jgi:hypothetical protein
VKIELLYWSGCPSVEAAISMMAGELARRGRSPDDLRLIQIVTLDDAQRENFPGSPTIRVNARDVAPTDHEPGLCCRVYRLRDGRVSALPDIADVRDALDGHQPA